MYALRVFYAFLACFTYFDLILSIPVNQSTAQELHQIMRNSGSPSYVHTLGILLSLASSGKTYFEQLDTPTEDCMRTATVTMNLLTKPSTGQKTYDMIRWSAARVFNETTASPNPVNILCKYINDDVKLSQFSVPDFEELKTKVELPKPTRNYLVTIPEGRSPREFLEHGFVIDDKAFFKYTTMVAFLDGRDGTKRAVEALYYMREHLKPLVDSEFIQVHEDYIKELSAKTIYNDASDVYTNLAPKVHDFFMNKSVEKEEYKKLVDMFGKPKFD